MPRKFKVSHGCSLTTATKPPRFVVGGSVVEEGELPAKRIAEFVQQGWIRPIDEEPNEAPKIVENQPGVEKSPVPLGGSLEKGKVVTATEISTTGVRQVPAVIPAPITQVESKWILDPAILEGKTVEELNVMVAERDADQAPFETAEEAAAHLSQDFAG